MIQKPLYIFIALLFAVLYQQASWAYIPTQSPEVYRVFDSDFKERYSDDRFNYEGRNVVGKSKVGSGEYEDYRKGDVKTREKNDNEEVIINLGPFGFIFYIVLAVAVVYLVYVLPNEGGQGLFSRSKNTAISLNDDITAENIEHADIHALIKQAENNKDYRLAIRYYYLLTLKTLSLKNHIKFEDDKTNAEYLNELHEKPFTRGFSYVSYLYNYIWYGKFHLEETQYSKAKANFTSLLKQVK